MDKAWGIFQKVCVGLTVVGVLLTPAAAASFYKDAAAKGWNAVSELVSSGADNTPAAPAGRG